MRNLEVSEHAKKIWAPRSILKCFNRIWILDGNYRKWKSITVGNLLKSVSLKARL